jgi:hypothetical protein
MDIEHEKIIFKLVDGFVKGNFPSNKDLLLDEHVYMDLLNEIQYKLGYVQNIYFIADEKTGVDLMPILSSACVTAMGFIFLDQYKKSNQL